MKKLLFYTLCFALMTLCSCGNNAGNNEESNEDQTTESPKSGESRTKADKAKEPEKAPEKKYKSAAERACDFDNPWWAKDFKISLVSIGTNFDVTLYHSGNLLYETRSSGNKTVENLYVFDGNMMTFYRVNLAKKSAAMEQGPKETSGFDKFFRAMVREQGYGIIPKKELVTILKNESKDDIVKYDTAIEDGEYIGRKAETITRKMKVSDAMKALEKMAGGKNSDAMNKMNGSQTIIIDKESGCILRLAAELNGKQQYDGHVKSIEFNPKPLSLADFGL